MHLHAIEKALLAVSDKWSHQQVLAFRPLKIHLDRASDCIQRALLGDNLDASELREYPSFYATQLSHPTILMENHQREKRLAQLVREIGHPLHSQRMQMVHTINNMRRATGEQKLSYLWLPDIQQPFKIQTFQGTDALRMKNLKNETIIVDDVPRDEDVQPVRLNTKLAKNRPIKKRPAPPMTAPPKKTAMRMRSSD